MLESFLGKYFESTDAVGAAQILTKDYANACLIYSVACDLLLHARSEFNIIGGVGDKRLQYKNQDSLRRIQALEVDKLADEIQAATGSCHRPPFAVVKRLKEIGKLPDTEAILHLRAYLSSLSDTSDSSRRVKGSSQFGDSGR